MASRLVGGHDVAGGKKKNMNMTFHLVWLELLKATASLVLTIWGTSAAAHLVQEASGVRLCF